MEISAFGSKNASQRFANTVQTAPDSRHPCKKRSSGQTPVALRIFRYLANLEGTKLILWCYLCWYVAIALQYFDPAPGLWVSSLGISGLIGFALNLAAKQKGQASDRWIVFRLYLFPFCVSSYSALIKGKGFFLLFPPDFGQNLIGIAACLGFVSISLLCRLFLQRARLNETAA